MFVLLITSVSYFHSCFLFVSSLAFLEPEGFLSEAPFRWGCWLVYATSNTFVDLVPGVRYLLVADWSMRRYCVFFWGDV